MLDQIKDHHPMLAPVYLFQFLAGIKCSLMLFMTFEVINYVFGCSYSWNSMLYQTTTVIQ